ncbi:MAG: 50S ribosomal protein L25 [Aerococcus sp.]|nr:50S ribosomal protein L25 [Aerococcus sp.]
MKFVAKQREAAGTTASKQVRKEDQVPGIVYSSDIDPIKVQMPIADVELIERELGVNSVFDLDIEGDETRTVFLREISRSSLKPIIYNISMQAIKKGQKLDINIPISVVDEDQLADADGVASTSLFKIKVNMDPALAPEVIEVSVKGLSIGDSVSVSELKFDHMEDAEILDDPEEAVVSISAPDEEPSDEDLEAAGIEEQEPEVIDEKPGEIVEDAE